MKHIQVGDVLGKRELVTIRSERVQIPEADGHLHCMSLRLNEPLPAQYLMQQLGLLLYHDT